MHFDDLRHQVQVKARDPSEACLENCNIEDVDVEDRVLLDIPGDSEPQNVSLYPDNLAVDVLLALFGPAD